MKRVSVSAWLAHLLAALILATIGLQVVIEFSASVGGAIGDLGFFLLLIATAAVGWLLAWKRPRNPLGWLLIAVAGFFVLQVPSQLIGAALRSSSPIASGWVYWFSSEWTWIPPVGLLFTQIPLRFPEGRLPSPRWRWFSWYTIVSIIVSSAALATGARTVAHEIANPTYVPWTSVERTTLTIIVFAAFLAPSFVGSIVSLFVRYRNANSVARAQLRWVFWGATIPIALLTLGWIFPAFFSFDQPFLLATYALIPISIGVAVMRYGLYGIDRIISRTVSYAIVTIVIVAVYVGIVLGIGALLPKANSVGVAIATLAAAAVFLPLLRWVQNWVDRRFNRAAYNAQQVVDAFGERLRNGADPHTASDDLTAAVAQTLQPSALGVWVPRGHA